MRTKQLNGKLKDEIYMLLYEQMLCSLNPVINP